MDIASFVRFDPRILKLQTGGIRDPADCYHRKRSFRAITLALFGKNHSDSTRYLFKAFDIAKVLVNYNAGDAESIGNRGGNVFILGMQDARTRLKELDP